MSPANVFTPCINGFGAKVLAMNGHRSTAREFYGPIAAPGSVFGGHLGHDPHGYSVGSR